MSSLEEDCVNSLVDDMFDTNNPKAEHLIEIENVFIDYIRDHCDDGNKIDEEKVRNAVKNIFRVYKTATFDS